MLDPAVIEFIHGGVAVGVATRDDDLRPEFARGWGPEVSTDGRSLRLCVAAPAGSRMLANLERVERHFRAFVAEAARIGAPTELSQRMFVSTGLVAFQLSIDEVFDQTPGPTAGRRL